MKVKKIIIAIVSILLLTTTIAGVVVTAVKFWPKSDEIKEQKDDKTEGKDQKDQNLKTYQDLENLKNNFDKSYKDADLKNFENPTAEFKKSQEKFISDFKTKLETFQTEFNKIDKNNSDQINKLYKDYEQTVNECHTEVEKLKKQYQPKDQKGISYYASYVYNYVCTTLSNIFIMLKLGYQNYKQLIFVFSKNKTLVYFIWLIVDFLIKKICLCTKNAKKEAKNKIWLMLILLIGTIDFYFSYCQILISHYIFSFAIPLYVLIIFCKYLIKLN